MSKRRPSKKRKASRAQLKRVRARRAKRVEQVLHWLNLGALKRLNLQPITLLASAERLLIAFFLFALPLIIYLGNTEYGYTKSIFALFMVSLLLVLWGIELLGPRKQETVARVRVWLTPLFLPGVALFLAGALSMIHATAVNISLQSLNLFLYFFLFYLVVANHTRSERDLLLYLGSILAAAFLASVYGILQYFGVLPGTPGALHGSGAIISSLGNKNYLGGFIVYLFWPGFILLLRARSWPVRSFSLLSLSTIIYTLVLVNSDGVWLALTVAGLFLVSGLLYFKLHQAFRFKRGWVAIGALLLLLLAAQFLSMSAPRLTSPASAPSPSQFQAGPAGGLPESRNLWQESELGLPVIDQLVKLWQRNAGRVRAWDWWVGWEMFKDHPLTGIGLGHYKVRFLEYKAKFLRTPRGKHYNFHILRAAQAHNEYVQLAAETGVLGLLAGGFALLMIFLTGLGRVKHSSNPGDRFILLALLAGVVAVLTHALVSFPFHLPASALDFVLLLGLLNSRYLAERTGELTGTKKQKRERGWRFLLYQPTVAVSRRAAYVFLAGVLLLGASVTTLAYRDFIADTYLDKAQRELKLGRVAQAQEYFERSLKLDFQPASTLYWLGSIYHQQAENSKDEKLIRQSIRYLEGSLRSFQVEPTYLQLATLYRLLGDYDKAMEYIKELLAMEPAPERKLKAEYLAALIARDRGDVEDALDRLTKLIAAHRDFEQAYVSRAQLYAQQGNEGLARLDLQAALKIVKRKLEQAKRTLQRLDEQHRLTLDKYAELRNEIEKLRSEKDSIEQLLLK